MHTDDGGWLATYIVTNSPHDATVDFFPRLGGAAGASYGSFPKAITAPSGDGTGPDLATRWAVYNAHTSGER
eukprot:3686830-Prymnesium_polylepis.1